MAYDHGGIEALKPRPNGGRKHENMTLVEEEALLARFAKAAGAGEMLNIRDLKVAYEKAKAQHQCSTGVERRRIVIVAGKRSVCRNWQACSGCADAENRNESRNHAV